MTSERDPREAAADSYLSWAEAIREMRLRKIRGGEYKPRPDDPEEVAAHAEWQRERERRG